jgi:hypothetical protein
VASSLATEDEHAINELATLSLALCTAIGLHLLAEVVLDIDVSQTRGKRASSGSEHLSYMQESGELRVDPF